jgi:hypothetical protein
VPRRREKDPRAAVPGTARRLLYRLRGKQLVHFLHVGKTGGTAVKHALRDATSRRYVVHVHPHHVRLRHVAPGDGVFFFLRDPIRRFVSGFYSRQRQGMPRGHFPWLPEERIAFSRFVTPNALALALSSDDAEERDAAERAMRSIRHVKSRYWDWFGDERYFLSRAADILLVGRQETLARDFERLKTLLDLPPHLALPGDEVESHRNPADVDVTLDDTARANLKLWYREDYRFLALCQGRFGPG